MDKVYIVIKKINYTIIFFSPPPPPPPSNDEFLVPPLQQVGLMYTQTPQTTLP